MSAAAGSRAKARAGRARLAGLARRLDEAVASGRLPALLMAIITGLVLWAFLFTDDFRVAKVSVEGLQYGAGNEVVEQADLLDRSAFRAQPELAAARIAELPFVERVTVELRFPGEATISIIERTPVVNVEQDGDTLLASSEGIAIAPGFVEGLPLVRLDSRGDGLAETLDPAIVAAVAAVAGVYGPDAVLVWNPDIGLVLEMPGGELVNFGAPESMDAKLTVLKAIEDQLDEGWSQLDLSVPTRPSYD